jgi:malonyl-CoA/methylmalonyl-CoA synthetase
MPAPFLDTLRTTFRDRASHPAVVHQGRTIAFAELAELARRGAGWLQGLGVRKGDRVALCTSDKLAFLLAHLATLQAGAISLPLNPRFTAAELRFFLGDSGARVVVAGEEARPVIESQREALPNLAAVVPDRAVHTAPTGSWREPVLTADDPCLIIYSSGTTGWPKGIVHTHANLASSLRALGACWRFTPDDVVLNVLPLFHIHGLSFATQLTLLTGGCVLLDEFEPYHILERLRECTVFMAVPTIYYRFLELPEFRDAAQRAKGVRLYTCGSAPIRAEVLPELEAILGRPAINRYGMSEAFVITSLPLDGPWPCGSVGLPLNGVEIRVVGAEGTTETPAGSVGAVQLRGPNLFREYWNQPDATQATFATGWFDTGDLGQRDAAGFLTLVGRKNDLIITNGYNVYPQVVERVLHECPGVREAVVVGVPDERRGERVAAAVVRDDPMLDVERLQAFLGEQLVDYQRPREVMFVEALPRNAMGKVLRRMVREQILQQGGG